MGQGVGVNGALGVGVGVCVAVGVGVGENASRRCRRRGGCVAVAVRSWGERRCSCSRWVGCRRRLRCRCKVTFSPLLKAWQYHRRKS